MVTRLRQYVEDHQKNWDFFLQPLKYVYHTQVRRSTNEFPYSLVSSHHQPGPMLLSPVTIEPEANINEISLQVMRKLLQQRIIALRAKSGLHMRKSQARYKADNNNRVCASPIYISGGYIFVDNSPGPTNETTADAVESQAYNKLQPRATGPFKILQVHEKMLVVGAIEFTRQYPLLVQLTILRHRLQRRPQRIRNVAPKPLPQNQDNSAQGDTEYVVKHIVGHIGKKPSVKYDVRWCGYDR